MSTFTSLTHQIDAELVDDVLENARASEYSHSRSQ